MCLGKLHDHLLHKRHRLLPIVIRSESQRRGPILESEQLWRGSSILWPCEASCVRRVEMVDEIDKVIRHVSWAEDVGNIGSMKLNEHMNRVSLIF